MRRGPLHSCSACAGISHATIPARASRKMGPGFRFASEFCCICSDAFLISEAGCAYLLQAVSEPVAHARPSEPRRAHIMDVIGGENFIPEVVLQVGVLGAPHKLIDVQVDHPVGQVAVLVRAVLRIQAPPQSIAVPLPRPPLHAHIVPAMFPARSQSVSQAQHSLRKWACSCKQTSVGASDPLCTRVATESPPLGCRRTAPGAGHSLALRMCRVPTHLRISPGPPDCTLWLPTAAVQQTGSRCLEQRWPSTTSIQASGLVPSKLHEKKRQPKWMRVANVPTHGGILLGIVFRHDSRIQRL